jgi:predicted NBD/HSP70 family sugar kinase
MRKSVTGTDGGGLSYEEGKAILTRGGERSDPLLPRRSLISASAVGSVNRGRVLQTLFDLGPTSRAELARQTGVNRATITGIIQPLVDRRILVEGEPLPSSEGGGKPARPLWFAGDAQPICGVLMMHDGVRSCLVSLDGRIDAEAEEAFPVDAKGVDALAAVIGTCVERTLSRAHRAPFGIGVAASGMVDTDHGRIVAVNLAPLLAGFDLGPYLEGRFGLPAVVDHHPRALLVGDRWFGQGRGRRIFAAIYTGDVLGASLYLDGHLYRGPAGAGGEIGHTFVQVDGEVCRCGRRGCWETIATTGWLRREAARLRLPEAAAMTSARLVALVDAGAPGAAGLLDRYARNVAVGIANLQQIMAPGVYILHGDVAAGGRRLVEAIGTHVRDLVPARPGGEIELLAGDLEDDAALRGAAGLVLSDLLQFDL